MSRSGAAQSLSELLVAGGAQLTETVMVNEILPLKSHPKAKAGKREGVIACAFERSALSMITKLAET